MAPVRHGKSKLFEHLCMFLWLLDPNLRVLWVSVTSAIAEKPGAADAQWRSCRMSS